MNGIQNHNNWKYITSSKLMRSYDVRINHKRIYTSSYSIIDIIIHHNNENTAESNSVV